MIRVAVVSLILGWTLALLPALAYGADPKNEDALVYGHWTPPDMDAVIAIEECGEALCAELVAHNYAEEVDTDFQNPDPQLRKRPLLGLKILDNLHMVKSGKWGMGTLYDPRTGKSYRSVLRLLDENRIKITGCIGPGLCKGYVWTRVEDAVESGPSDGAVQH